MPKSKSSDSSSEEDEFLPLRGLPSRFYADMVKEALESRGIPCLVQGDILSSAYGVSGAGVGSMLQILVPKDRYRESQELVEQLLGHI